MRTLTFEVTDLHDFHEHLTETFRLVHDAVGRSNGCPNGVFTTPDGTAVSGADLAKPPRGAYRFGFSLREEDADLTALREALALNPGIRLLA